MSAVAAQDRAVPDCAGAELLAPGLLAIAAANGWAARLLAPDAPSVSLFAPLALAVALAPLLRGRPASLAPLPAALAALLILAPSGALAWAALALVAAAAPVERPSRALLLLLAAAEVLASVGLNQIKPALLPIEAALAAGLLPLAGHAPDIAGNVILLDGRMTIVAAGCSGLAGAVFAGLGALALLVWRGARLRPAAWLLPAALAAASAFAANLVRLAAMATDERLYVLAHGQAGALATDLAASAGVILAVLAAEKLRA